MATKITVNASKTYDVIIENSNIFDALSPIADYFSSSKAMIVTDSNVGALYLSIAKARLVESTANAVPEPCPPHWSDLKTLIAKPLQKIMLTEGITRDEAKKLLEDCANELYNLYPETFKK